MGGAGPNGSNDDVLITVIRKQFIHGCLERSGQIGEVVDRQASMSRFDPAAPRPLVPSALASSSI